MTAPEKTGHYRWIICALLFFATTINYVDRGVVGILKTTLQGEFGWNEIDYSNIVFAFQSAYAIGLMLAGRLMDKVGTKAGYAIALIVWSLAAVACAEATTFGPAAASLLATVGFVTTPSVAGFMAARFALGVGEGGNFPAAIKSVAEWFPRRERALATGIFNSGTNVGAIVTPLVVPWITVRYGWYWAFVITGALGFFWLIAWWLMYDTPERHPRVTPAELAHINSDPPESTTPVPWAQAVPAPRGVGVCDRQVHDRSDLVAVPVLAGRFPPEEARPLAERRQRAADRDLPGGRRRQHRRRMAVVGAHQARMVGERRAQDGDADLRVAAWCR